MTEPESVQQGPERLREPRELLATRAKTVLRQSVWEAAQFMSADETRAFVDSVLSEIDSDEP